MYKATVKLCFKSPTCLSPMLMFPPSLSMPVDKPIILNSLTAVPKPCYHVAHHQELNICCLLHLGNVSQWNFSSVQIDQWWSNDLPLSEAIIKIRLHYLFKSQNRMSKPSVPGAWVCEHKNCACACTGIFAAIYCIRKWKLRRNRENSR